MSYTGQDVLISVLPGWVKSISSGQWCRWTTPTGEDPGIVPSSVLGAFTKPMGRFSGQATLLESTRLSPTLVIGMPRLRPGAKSLPGRMH